MIITVSLNPALDKAICVEGLTVDGVNRVLSTRLDAGGKGINVSKLVKVLGGETLATGIIGGSSGMFIQQQMDKMNIRHDFVVSDQNTRTNLKISDRLRHTTTEVNEPGAPVTEELLDAVWNKIESVAKTGDAVVLSGANPPGMGENVLAEWITKLNDKGIITALDTVGEPLRLGIQAKPYLIKPNQTELSDLFGEELHYVRDLIAAARHVVQQGVERVIVSMGSDGALFVTKEQILRGYGLQVPIGSTVGSGDAMMAAILHHMQKGSSWEETVRWGLATSAANAMCEGSKTPNMEQIQELMKKVVVEQLV